MDGFALAASPTEHREQEEGEPILGGALVEK